MGITETLAERLGKIDADDSYEYTLSVMLTNGAIDVPITGSKATMDTLNEVEDALSNGHDRGSYYLRLSNAIIKIREIIAGTLREAS